MKTLIYALFGIVLGRKTVVRGIGWLTVALLLTGCATTPPKEQSGTILLPQVEYVK